MRTLRSLAFIAALFSAAPAFAQGQLGPFKFPGNPTNATAPAKPSTVDQFLLQGTGISITGSPRPTIALANTSVTAGSCGSSSQSCVLTIDAQGRITAQSNATITPAAIGAVPTARNVTAGTGLSGGGDLSADRSFACSVFTSSLLGCVPGSGGGTTNFLRADGTWAFPPGGGTVTSVTCANGTVVITTSGTCPERELLSTDRIYYIGTDGNDACNGLTNAGGSSGNCAWQNFTHAMLVITGQIDFGGHNVTLQCRAAHCSYTGGAAAALNITPWVGGGSFTFDGGGGTINAPGGQTAVAAVAGTCPGPITVQNVTVGGNTSGGGIASYTNNLTVGPGVIFAATTFRQIDAEQGGVVRLFNNYSISGGSQIHMYVFQGGAIVNNTLSIVVTFTGTAPYSSAFAASTFSTISLCNATYNLNGQTVTTPNNSRYNVSFSGNINTCSGSQTFFPGTGSGTPQGQVSTNGVYQ